MPKYKCTMRRAVMFEKEIILKADNDDDAVTASEKIANAKEFEWSSSTDDTVSCDDVQELDDDPDEDDDEDDDDFAGEDDDD